LGLGDFGTWRLGDLVIDWLIRYLIDYY